MQETERMRFCAVSPLRDFHDPGNLKAKDSDVMRRWVRKDKDQGLLKERCEVLSEIRQRYLQHDTRGRRHAQSPAETLRISSQL